METEKIMTPTLKKQLTTWYLANQRPLPWRRSRDPYAVWVSEVMLQQTTSQAVIPFYERFMARFPNLQTLAEGSLDDVYAQWSGLGYYSRARNLHKAAQQLARSGFPQRSAELLELPGFGPYTARAVASIAFGEPVGVLDGNVIRVICRFDGNADEWWKTSVRRHLQERADAIVQGTQPEIMNQALMELGATICTPQSPTCFLCPIRSGCQAYKTQQTPTLPLKKPRRAIEAWLWEPRVHIRRHKIALVKNTYAPFLKDQWILPGRVAPLKKAPKTYALRHSITHHDIFVTFAKNTPTLSEDLSTEATTWFELASLSKKVPVALIQKAVAVFLQTTAL
jgi:A/G-specific adenine glycosylase